MSVPRQLSADFQQDGRGQCRGEQSRARQIQPQPREPQRPEDQDQQHGKISTVVMEMMEASRGFSIADIKLWEAKENQRVT